MPANPEAAVPRTVIGAPPVARSAGALAETLCKTSTPSPDAEYPEIARRGVPETPWTLSAAAMPKLSPSLTPENAPSVRPSTVMLLDAVMLPRIHTPSPKALLPRMSMSPAVIGLTTRTAGKGLPEVTFAPTPLIASRPVPALMLPPVIETPNPLTPDPRAAPVNNKPSESKPETKPPKLTLPPPLLMFEFEKLMYPLAPAAGFRPARRLMFSGPPALLMDELSALTKLSAMTVKLPGLAAVTLIEAPLMNTKPACRPTDTPPVDTMTSVPAFRAAAMVAVDSSALGPVAVNDASKLELGPKSEIVMLYGSSSHVPARPSGADRSIASGRASSQPPEVSMKPPLPPAAPPRALKLPKARVAASLHRMILPPSPEPRASAVMLASRPKNTARAFGTDASLPSCPPPSNTSPPLPWPETSTRAPSSTPISRPSSRTCPPLPVSPRALTVPRTMLWSPSSVTRPPLPPLAETMLPAPTSRR